MHTLKTRSIEVVLVLNIPINVQCVLICGFPRNCNETHKQCSLADKSFYSFATLLTLSTTLCLTCHYRGGRVVLCCYRGRGLCIQDGPGHAPRPIYTQPLSLPGLASPMYTQRERERETDITNGVLNSFLVK